VRKLGYVTAFVVALVVSWTAFVYGLFAWFATKRTAPTFRAAPDGASVTDWDDWYFGGGYED